METIGERIKRRRKELGMSQEELALKAGYRSRSSINKIEVEGRGFPQKKIVAIATALQTTPAYLMRWDDEPDALLTKRLTSFKYYSDTYRNDNLDIFDEVETSWGYGIRRIIEQSIDLNTDGLNKVLEYIRDLSDKYRKD